MDGKRFEKIYTQGISTGMDIWLDRATGIQYLRFWSPSGGGVTPLLGRDGKPVISPIPED